MSKLSAKACEAAKPDPSGKDRMLGDGDGLYLRVRPAGTKTWVVEYIFEARRRKSSIGIFDLSGAPGDSVTAWLEYGRLSLAQARAIAGQWKADRRAGRDPVAEWEARVAGKRAEREAARHAAAKEAEQPTVRQAIEQFLSKQIGAKRSASTVEYRLRRLADLLGDKKIRDVTRSNVGT
jgi:hypothetical protein